MAKKSSKKVWYLLGLIILALFLYFQVGEKQKSPFLDGEKPNIEKTGAGVVADFTVAATTIHRAVDSSLTKAKLTVKDLKEMRREAPRQTVEGIIRWHTRQLLINLPAGVTVASLQQALQAGVSPAGGEVLAVQPDNYQGLAVVRLDIGFHDTLAGDPLTIISDRLYISQGKKESPIMPLKPQLDGSVQGEMALVIDDFGYNQETIEQYATMGRPITFSVLPYRQFSNEAATRALSAGQQVMLHLPMEPLSSTEEQEQTSLQVQMNDAELSTLTTKAIHSLPGIIGVNNHQGSRATADGRMMNAVMKVMKANNLFFIDSRTNSRSVAFDIAKQAGIRTGENALFLDNSSDIAAIKKQLHTAAELATRNGSVIVIGHARHNTAIAIKEAIPELEASGIKFVFVSQLVK